jgi:hypothetical protein
MMKPRIILDTDIGGDIDDLGTLALLHNLAHRGHCELIGVMSDTPQAAAIPCIQAVNAHYGRPDLPVGRPQYTLLPEDTYAQVLAARRPDLPPPEAAPRAENLYRRLLAAQPDGAVTIVCIGWLHLARSLLNTTADEFSPLTGRELIARKVTRFVIMGGYDDATGQTRPEPNFSAWNSPGVTRDFVRHCPVPQAFIGSELGQLARGYGCGARLRELPAEHPVRIGYADFFARPPWWANLPAGGPIVPWSIWDQITAYHAVMGDDAWLAGERGLRNEVDEVGLNRWVPDAASTHVRVRALRPPAAIARELIEPLMLD